MDNFQHNWPPFWGYIFYFPFPLRCSSCLSARLTPGVAYMDICYHGSERPFLECFMTCWGWTGLYIRALVPEFVATSPQCRRKAYKCEIWVSFLSALKVIQGNSRQMLLRTLEKWQHSLVWISVQVFMSEKWRKCRCQTFSSMKTSFKWLFTFCELLSH